MDIFNILLTLMFLKYLLRTDIHAVDKTTIIGLSVSVVGDDGDDDAAAATSCDSRVDDRRQVADRLVSFHRMLENGTAAYEYEQVYVVADAVRSGLEPGCVTARDGRGNWKTLYMYCLTPTNNRFAIKILNPWNRVEIILNKKNSNFVCDELNIAKPFYETFFTPDERGDIQLETVVIYDLKLPPESLSCILSAFDAKGIREFYLDKLVGGLKNVHVRGLGNVTGIEITHDPSYNNSIPVFDILSHAIKTVTIEYGAMDLTPVQLTFPTLDTIKLSYGNITSLPRGTFKNAPNLYTLVLTDNNIQYIDADAFQSLRKLRLLNLEKNMLSSLPEGVFRLTPNLRQIYLNKNYIKYLTPGVFSGLIRMETIKLRDNKADLKLHNSTFANLKTLIELDLKSSRISALPEDVFRDSVRLQKLILSDNAIQELPTTLFANLQIKYLHLDKNSIKTLLVGLFADLRELKHLDLGYNLLEKFDDLLRFFYDLRNLSTLILDSNRIKTLHPALFYFVPKLEELSLADNGLTISKSHNVYPATDVYFSTQRDNTFNSAGERWYSPFQNLQHLRILNLKGNNISIICTDWRSLSSLQQLDLSNNSITSLTSEDMRFRSNPNVDLRNNKVKHFDPFVYEYENNQHTPRFLMSDNPYNCSCAFLPFKQKLSLNNVTYFPFLDLSRATCADPTHLRGAKLSPLSELPFDICNTETSPTSSPTLENSLSTTTIPTTSSVTTDPSSENPRLSFNTIPTTTMSISQSKPTPPLKVSQKSVIPIQTSEPPKPLVTLNTISHQITPVSTTEMSVSSPGTTVPSVGNPGSQPSGQNVVYNINISFNGSIFLNFKRFF